MILLVSSVDFYIIADCALKFHVGSSIRFSASEHVILYRPALHSPHCV